jgi:1,4-alpha-glucan branching enzyme
MSPSPQPPLGQISDDDLHLFNEGNHGDLYSKLGAHPIRRDGRAGTAFAVWAPDAEAVGVMGDFNGWSASGHPLRPRGSSGIWEGFVPAIGRGAVYKYHIASRHHGYTVEKADPCGLRHELPPRTGSVVWDLDYAWGDAEWMASRGSRNALGAPLSIYELHLGSWRRSTDPEAPPLGYRELAPQLIEHVGRLGFTHVELMPVTEHPFYGSWGYQCTGYYAPTSRYGTPQDLMWLIDQLHQAGIGVILDWVPSHFPTDQHGLGFFDGTHLYEHADERQGFHPDWSSAIFNYGRKEVCSFLLSSAMLWLDRYHADGLRVDAVASMLYLDYSREEGEWIPNRFGGRENLEAIEFLRSLNHKIYERFPDVQTLAEESTAWPMVSRPTWVGGLGFGLKWDMGWMHDTLSYLRKEPIHRKYHHDQLTFRALYAFHENFVLPLSHDEVVHGKRSLLEAMPGDEWQRFANLRLLLGLQYAQPGKKLLFMGGEFGQRREWDHDSSLDWHLLEQPLHAGVMRWVEDLNRVYRQVAPLHVNDCRPEGFRWVDASDATQSVLSFLRVGDSEDETVLVVVNATPVPRHAYRVGVPRAGRWRELLNSDASEYGGSGLGNLGEVRAERVTWHGQPRSLSLTIPPLGILFLSARS